MTSTLIVRDVLALVHGGGPGEVDLEQHLRDRAAAVAELPTEQVEEALELLAPSAGDEASTEVLSAALILSLAHPRQSAAHQLSAAVHGRRLAAAYERDDDIDHAFATLRVVAEATPNHPGIERATAALMRRQGMVQELVERYLERAQRHLDEGEHHAAIPWLREVLLLDRSRKDVARMIRDLRFDEVESARARKRRVRVAVVALAFSLAISFLALREVRVHKAYAEIPQGQHGDLVSLRAHLNAVEGFVDRYPIWHGALGVLQQRSELRVEIDGLVQKQKAKEERREDARERQDERAESVRHQGRVAAERGDYALALKHFEKALEIATAEWPHRARTTRDVEAIKAHLKESGE